MTNEEKIKELLEDYIKQSSNHKSIELSYMMINDSDYAISVLAIVTYLCATHPTLLADLIVHVLQMRRKFNILDK